MNLESRCETSNKRTEMEATFESKCKSTKNKGVEIRIIMISKDLLQRCLYLARGQAGFCLLIN